MIEIIGKFSLTGVEPSDYMNHISSQLCYVTMETIWKNTGGFVDGCCTQLIAASPLARCETGLVTSDGGWTLKLRILIALPPQTESLVVLVTSPIHLLQHVHEA